jgi:hypothetical protein
MLNFIQILLATERMLERPRGQLKAAGPSAGKPSKIEGTPPMVVVVLN